MPKRLRPVSEAAPSPRRMPPGAAPARADSPAPGPAQQRVGTASVWARPPAAVARDKQAPYTPRRDGDVALLNLNTAVQAQPAAGGRPVAVVCTHLAELYYRAPHKRNDFLQQARTPDGIGALVAGQAQAIAQAHYQRSRLAPEASKQLISGSRLGHYLKDVAISLAQRGSAAGNARADIQLSSGDHAMAASVELKSDDAAREPRICITVYDPNVTATHRRVEAASAGDLESLTLKDFVAPGAPYGQDGTPVGAVCLEAFPAHQDSTRYLDRGSASPDTAARAVLVAMTTNSPQQLQAAIDALLGQRSDEATLAHALGPSAGFGSPPLATAMTHGNTAAVRAFGELLVQRPVLGSQTLATLLEGQDVAGRPGLLKAAIGGHSGAIEAFGEVLRQLGAAGRLEPDQVERLLHAQAGPMPPALTMMCLNPEAPGAVASITGYLRAVAAQDLDEPAKLRLIVASFQGVPALHTAVHANRAAAIEAFGAELPALALPPAGVEAFLSAPDTRGNPPLAVAMYDRSLSAMTALGAVIGGQGLDAAARCRLLRAPSANGDVPALGAALATGVAAEAVQAYASLVRHSGLSERQQVGLLVDTPSGQGPERRPVVEWALRAGQANALTVWGQAIEQAGLNPQRVLEALQATGDAPTPLLAAAANTETCQAFEAVLQRLQLAAASQAAAGG